MRILVVEDEESIRTLEGELIESFGHEAFLAETASEAAEKLAMVKPDLILLDLLLRGYIAVPFIKLARELMSKKPPRIVVVSALQNARAVAESNNVEFLAKPFDMDDFKLIIEGKYVRPPDREPHRKTDAVVRP